jgi:ABC-type bacteriocin/lantibiotic exporter with double-glycine peptidase domain
MKHLRQIRKTFVRQLGRNDCGVACICMVLKFVGNETGASLLRAATISEQAHSMLDLRDLAGKAGISSRCVKMELDFLRTNLTPCILHLNHAGDGNHYQVCYGAVLRRNCTLYLMGDPAIGMHYISENLLDVSWVSRAALYFDDLPQTPARQARSTWHLLLLGDLIPKGLLFSIPLLHIGMATFGIAWSWALQRGINDSIAGKKDHLIAGIITLLLLVMLAKNLFSYIRQQLMIRLNSTVNKHLMLNLIRRIIENGALTGSSDQSYFKTKVSSMMKMQQALSAFLVSVLSEGSLVVLVMAALFYQSVIVGWINSVYLTAIILYMVRTFPDTLSNHNYLNELSGSAEKMILMDMLSSEKVRSPEETESVFLYHAANHSKYLDYAKRVSSGMSKDNLVQECLGTLNLICIFIDGIVKLRDESLDYSTFMVTVILSYFVTVLMPKICSFTATSEYFSRSQITLFDY